MHNYNNYLSMEWVSLLFTNALHCKWATTDDNAFHHLMALWWKKHWVDDGLHKGIGLQKCAFTKKEVLSNG